MEIKSQLSSKTNWFNFISLVLFVIALPDFISILPTNVLPYLAILTYIGNYILRNFFTSQPTTEFAAKQEPSEG